MIKADDRTVPKVRDSQNGCSAHIDVNQGRIEPRVRFIEYREESEEFRHFILSEVSSIIFDRAFPFENNFLNSFGVGMGPGKRRGGCQNRGAQGVQ